MENLSLFNETDSSQNQITLDVHSKQVRLDVVKMQYLETQSMTWEQLFSGFDKIYVITYSSGIGFICNLLKNFSYAEIIFGCEDVISYSLQEVMAYQLKTINRLNEQSSLNKIDLVSRINNNTLKLFVARKILSHEKIYLLESTNGNKRVVMGSANMSYTAFSGLQRENICYSDGDDAFNWYMNCFQTLKEESSDNISSSSLIYANDDENLEELPIAQTVKVKKALVIEPCLENTDDIRFVLDIKNLSSKFSSSIPKADKKGKILLTPDNFKIIRKRAESLNIQEKELRSEYPHLVIDTKTRTVTLNGINQDLTPPPDSIRKDVSLFLEYIDGYKKFHGDVCSMQSRYYEFANWFFTSPFMPTMRDMAIKYNQNLLPYPVFGLVYGQSKAGKTSFLETLLKMMIGQKTKISAPDFTRSSIENLKRTVEGAPIIVDDLTNTRFNQHAIETIKNDDFGVADHLLNYPAVVISANEDVKAVAPEVIRRTVICRVQAGLTNTELMKSSIVRRVQRDIGTAFYHEYLRRMLDIIPNLVECIKEDTETDAPDILTASSKTLYDIISEYSDAPIPFYIRPLTLEDYFSEKVTGSYAIKTIQNAWKLNKKSFKIDKRNNELRYCTGDVWEAGRILKELPEDLEPHKSRDWIVMNLDSASNFFDIKFTKGLFG